MGLLHGIYLIMGWLIGFSCRSALVQHLTRPVASPRWTCTALRFRFVGYRNLWVVYEARTPGACDDEADTVHRYITLHLIAKHADGWGYKSIADSMGPAEVNCPLRYLEGLTLDDPEQKVWRNQVREYHRRRGTGVRLRIGSTVTLRQNCEPRVLQITRLRPLQGMAGGTQYRLHRRLIDLDGAA